MFPHFNNFKNLAILIDHHLSYSAYLCTYRYTYVHMCICNSSFERFKSFNLLRYQSTPVTAAQANKTIDGRADKLTNPTMQFLLKLFQLFSQFPHLARKTCGGNWRIYIHMYNIIYVHMYRNCFNVLRPLRFVVNWLGLYEYNLKHCLLANYAVLCVYYSTNRWRVGVHGL